MLAHTLFFALAASASPPSLSSDLSPVPEAHVRVLAHQVAASASSFQWQQLWHQARNQGRFRTSGAQPRFSMPHQELPDLARQVLVAPHRVVSQGPGRAALRRDFTPQVIGHVGNQPVNGLCLTVAWKDHPAPALSTHLEPPQQASLSSIGPC